MSDKRMWVRVSLAVILGLMLASWTPRAFAAGEPIQLSACGTISTAGSYVLTKSLTTSGTCFSITVSNVALDMKGHSITGDGTGDGISTSNAITNIAIANGTIRNFSNGINFPVETGDSVITLDNLKAINNAAVGINIAGAANTLRGVVASNNANQGISIGGCCNTLINIQARNNGGVGIQAFDCCSFVSNAVAVGNGSRGVDLEGCCSTLVNSKASNNGDDGVFMNGCCNSVMQSAANGNASDGIHLTNGENMVIGSDAINNASNGIDLLIGDHNSVLRSRANRNDQGLAIACPSNIVRLVAQRNSVNLLEDTTDGACTELNNQAPVTGP